MHFSIDEVSMFTASELGGFAASYALWSVAEKGHFVPMLVYITESHEIKVDCLETHDANQDVVRFGSQQLCNNEMSAKCASLVYETQVTLDDKLTRAIVVEIRSYSSPLTEAVISIPYSPKPTGTFRFHKPRIARFDKCDDSHRPQFLYSFIDGIEGNELGRKVWNDHFDISE